MYYKIIITSLVSMIILFYHASLNAEPIPISTIEELQKIGNTPDYPLDGNYILTQDIDAADTVNWNDGSGFKPIGEYPIAFTGIFDGQGYRILNLHITRVEEDYVGLFGYLQKGDIRNLGLESANISGNNSVGGLVAKNGGTISSCYAIANISGNHSIGGLVAVNYGTISTCYAKADVSGSGNNIGGLVGLNDGTISECYSAGTVSGSNEYVGGLVGQNPEGTVFASVWDIETSKMSKSTGGRGLTSTEMTSPNNFSNAGWDTSSWIMNNGEYPRLAWENTDAPPLPKTVEVPLDGNGTESDPYLIHTAADFAELSWHKSIINAHIELTSDIDCAGIQIHPVGEFGTYTGTFDGRGHVIKNVAIEQPMKDDVGLFIRLGETGEIRNVGLVDIIISGNRTVGGLVSNINEGIVSECYVTGIVKGNEYVGGLTGRNHGTIIKCYVTGIVTGNKSHVGGLAGYNSGIISKSFVTGEIIDNYDYVGGLVGSNNGTITECYTNSTVVGEYRVGGLAGSNSRVISKSFTMGNTESSGLVGGVAGWCDGTISECYVTGTVTGHGEKIGGLVGSLSYGKVNDCFASGTVKGNNYVGGLVGDNYQGTVFSSFWDTETTQMTLSAGGRGLNSSKMTAPDIFGNAGWESSTWVMNAGEYPRLAWENTGAPPLPEASPVPLDGNGTESDPYLIHTSADFAELSWHKSIVDAHIVLTSDIDCTGIQLHPIGALGTFTGVFDGGGHVIKNVVMEEPTMSNVGLFGSLGETGIIRNTGLENITITGDQKIGGLVGRLDNGTVSGCYVTGKIKGVMYVGGLVGYSLRGTVSDCYTNISISGEWYIATLVGYNNNGRLSNCYSTGIAKGLAHVGNMVGINYDGTAWACFWDIETSGMINSAAGRGLSTVEMTTPSVFGNAGWNPTIWTMNAGEYPRLAWENTGAPPLPEVTPVPLDGDGTESDPYLIHTASDLAQLSWHKSIIRAHIELTSDIDCTGVLLYPIGHLGVFNGVFDGKGHVIENVTLEHSRLDKVGFFSYLGTTGVIRNIGLQNINVEGNIYVGGLVGMNFGSVFNCFTTGVVTSKRYSGGLVGILLDDGTVTKCYSFSNVNGNKTAGGLVGWNRGGRITECYTSGTVTGDDNIGGLVGYNNGVITKSHATGAVTSDHGVVGGLVGRNSSGTISSCYATGTVTGGHSVGGLVGSNSHDTTLIETSYATGTVTGRSSVGGLIGWNGGTVSSSYSTGEVTGSGSNNGGLVGYIRNATLFQCYWDIESSGQISSDGDSGIIGRTTAEMTYPYGPDTYVDWDFEGIWASDDQYQFNNGYPYLRETPPPHTKNTEKSISGFLENSAPED